VTAPKPYYGDDHVQLFHGDMRELLPELAVHADACITDPPYGETSLAWDRWPQGWPALVARHTNSLWCFGSMRMFFANLADFGTWRMSQDIVWKKNAGSGFVADRFRRIHEHAVHFYLGKWSELYVSPVYITGSFGGHSGVAASNQPAHTGTVAPSAWVDNGTRLQRSVIEVRNCRGRAIHPTEKPVGILAPLVEYSVPPGGLVLDPFAGSASTLLAARTLGRRAIGIEANEEYCERAAKRLSEVDLFTGSAS
jgi:site-specific DNA-methyltransferase (adenine-specific)